MSHRRQRNRKNPLRPLWNKLRDLLRRFSRLPEDEIISDEPIDFSAPSVPYYTNLSEKFNLARIVLYMVLFVFVVVTVLSSRHLITYDNLYYLVKNINAATLTAQSQADYLNYPMSSATADFAIYRGGLTVAGGREITVLSGSGKQTLSENVSMSRPCVRAGQQYFITFSRGENDFSVYNGFVRLRKETTDFPIYEACMSRDGSFAVLTRSMDYTSEVIFYDDDMDKLAAAHISGYVTSLSISEDGKTVAILSLELKDQIYVTKLTVLRRGTSGITNREIFVEGRTALTSVFSDDDRLAVVFEDGLCLYKNNGDQVTEVSFEGTSPHLCAAADGYVAVLCHTENSLTGRELSVFDKNGRLAYRVDLSSVSNADELLLVGENAYIRTGERILYVTDRGNRLFKATVHRDTITLLSDEDGELLACGPAFAQRLSPSDFSPAS